MIFIFIPFTKSSELGLVISLVNHSLGTSLLFAIRSQQYWTIASTTPTEDEFRGSQIHSNGRTKLARFSAVKRHQVA